MRLAACATWREPAAAVRNRIHGLSPFPGARFEYAGNRVKILRATVVDRIGAPGAWLGDAIACGEGALAPIEVQRAGGGPMSFAEFSRGMRISAGTIVD